jgi:uncharacterized damage-inducible protein DinB
MRTAALVNANVDALLQARDVLERVSDSMYARAAPGTNGISIGRHMRHVLEFYECFLHGTDRGVIDYDSRTRSAAVETDRRVAAQRTDELLWRLQTMPGALAELPVHVCGEDTGILLASTFGRELQALVSHTIHHFAMIGVALHAWGISVDPTFGVAPATLRYRARTAEAA